MRSSDEQFQMVLARADRLREIQAARKAAMAWALSAVACLALLIAVVRIIPRTSAAAIAAGSAQYGSLLLGAPYMGYVVVGVLAFLLGICVTLLCRQLRRLREKERSEP